jgi:hypothetical protein
LHCCNAGSIIPALRACTIISMHTVLPGVDLEGKGGVRDGEHSIVDLKNGRDSWNGSLEIGRRWTRPYHPDDSTQSRTR